MNIFMHLFIAFQPALDPTLQGRAYIRYAYGPHNASSGDGKTSKKFGIQIQFLCLSAANPNSPNISKMLNRAGNHMRTGFPTGFLAFLH